MRPICKVLPIAPSTDYLHAARRADSEKQPVRARSDATLMIEIQRVFDSDRGSQDLALRYTERLAGAGIEPSVGRVGDSDDNALTETINGLSKAESLPRT